MMGAKRPDRDERLDVLEPVEDDTAELGEWDLPGAPLAVPELFPPPRHLDELVLGQVLGPPRAAGDDHSSPKNSRMRFRV